MPHVTLVNTMIDSSVLDREGVHREIRCTPGAHRRLPGADGRQLGQYPGCTQGRAEDRRQVAERLRFPGRPLAQADEIHGKVGREPARQPRYNCPCRASWPPSIAMSSWISAAEICGRVAGGYPGPAELVYTAVSSRAGSVNWTPTARDAACPRWMPRAPHRRITPRSLRKRSSDAWLSTAAAAELFAFDTETTSLDYMAGPHRRRVLRRRAGRGRLCAAGA